MQIQYGNTKLPPVGADVLTHDGRWGTVKKIDPNYLTVYVRFPGGKIQTYAPTQLKGGFRA